MGNVYSVILSILVSFLISALAGPVIIPYLIKLKFGQEIREIGPSWHKSKRGTPTMGGMIFIFSVLVCTALFMHNKVSLWLMLFALSFGIVGFADDFIKVVKKRNLGLTEKQKFIFQLVMAILFLYIGLYMDIITDEVIIPFWGRAVDFGWLYIPFALFVIIGTTNSVNLTDGVDGLATSVTVTVALFFAVISAFYGDYETMLFSLVIMGACLGFLLYNRHPAKVFMGDTGSLFLGGAVCAIAMRLKLPLLLIVAGGVYVIETLSVIIQVASFKLTGKRVFKMSPIHHHFEMCGWSEVKIVTVAVVVTLILCVTAFLGGYKIV